MANNVIVAFGRPFTTAESETFFNYMKGQMASGNTTGVIQKVGKVGLDALNYADLKMYEFQTSDQANAFVTFCNTFNPGPTWTQVLVPGEPFIIEI